MSTAQRNPQVTVGSSGISNWQTSIAGLMLCLSGALLAAPNEIVPNPPDVIDIGTQRQLFVDGYGPFEKYCNI